MIGERENFDSEINYGSLIMRPYEIEGNEINAFYDSSDNLIFVLDNTISARKPNVLLVINPDADKKWDEILSSDYGVDLETIRPKQDNKYQKLDIEYSGLSVYDGLIKAYDAGEVLEDYLNQLAILRDSAARHSAMIRLNAANEIISKTNITIVKTKESIVRLQARLKTLRAKLSEAKKGIGRGPTKQSAAKILKLESQIEATTEKIKRAQDRLKSAQRRLETATVDAELASDLLNQSSTEIKQPVKKNAAVMVAPKHRVAKVKTNLPAPQIIEDDDKEDSVDQDEEETSDYEDVSTETENAYEEEPEVVEETEEVSEETEEETKDDEDMPNDEQNDVKPLLEEDPQILNEDIAFKPISFEAPTNSEKSDDKEDKSDDDNLPMINQDMFITEEKTEEETKVETEEEPENKPEDKSEEENAEKPVLESMVPVVSVPEEKTFSEQIEEIDDWEEEEKPMLESMMPIPSVPEPEKKEENPETTVEEKVEEEHTTTEISTEDMRQQEPVYSPQNYDIPEVKENDAPAHVSPVPPVMPMSPMPRMAPAVEPERKSKPTFMYYLLLLILIVLAVFTLWLYQKNVTPSTPDLTATVEQTETSAEKKTFFKKSTKSDKPTKIEKKSEAVEEEVAVFLDEQPVEKVAIDPEPEIEEPIIEEQDEEVEIEPVAPTAPEVLDAVPARVGTSSGQDEDTENTVMSEDEILANKPVYEPGAKHDEMFVSEDDYGEEMGTALAVEQEEYFPEEDELVEFEEDVPQNDPYYDAEEAEYQAEQMEMYYEE